jgi:hypothetical protein
MRAHWIIVLFVVAVSCSSIDKAPHSKHENTYRGIAVQTDGPRGGGYTDASGKDFGYRVFRIHVWNDTTIPAELIMNFPSDLIALLPDTAEYINVFLFPDEVTPATARDTFNFGINGSEAFLRERPSSFSTRPSGPTSLRATVLPGEEHILYIGVVFPPYDLDGLARAELFIKGQKPNALFFPEGSMPTGTEDGTELDLIFGAAIDPPKHYSMIPCGQITFKK